MFLNQKTLVCHSSKYLAYTNAILPLKSEQFRITSHVQSMWVSYLLYKDHAHLGTTTQTVRQ